MKTNEIPSQSELHELFIERFPGILFWRQPSRGRQLSKPAGHLRKDGYTQINIQGKLYRRHRIIWKMHHGTVPDVLNHITGLENGDAIENLEESSCLHNQQNHVNKSKNNKSGYTGVSWYKPTQKWVASITINNKLKFLGYFLTPELASVTYQSAKLKYHNKKVKKQIL